MSSKRYFKITSGNQNFQLNKVINNATHFRISQLDYSHSAVTSVAEIVHLKIDDYVKCYDETNSLYYTQAFICHPSTYMSYTPAGRNEETWFPLSHRGVHDFVFEIKVDGNIISDMSSQNIYIELEFKDVS